MKKRTAWNKGKKETVKHVYYTNGVVNIRVPFDHSCPEGFTRGRVVKWSEETKNKAKIKRKQTCLNKYGDSNYNNKEKQKQTLINKYGVDNAHKLMEVKQRIKQTCLEKYGVDNPMKDSHICNKQHIAARNTCIEKYGVPSFSKTREYLEKINETCLDKYGVMYNCQTENCLKACGSYNSKPNENFYKKLSIIKNISIEREFHVENRSFDFKVDDILIEINPTATHNSLWGVRGRKGLDLNYHLLKRELAEKYHYKLINIYDWDDQDKIIFNLFREKKIFYAKNLTIKEVGRTEEINFLNTYHFQGYVKSDLALGLYTKSGELISIMTFGKPRYNKNYALELLRYCSNSKVAGGVNKLWKYFMKKCSPRSIISYCDLNKFDGSMYKELGFNLLRTTIGVHWYNMKTKQHITDNLLRQRGFDQLFGTNYGKGTSNEELMIKTGFVKIYDAGQSTYVWNK